MRQISDQELKAQAYAVTKHGTQLYSTGLYSETHLPAVVQVLIDCGYDDPYHLACGWLHDTAEDTGCCLHEFAAEHGSAVFRAVMAVSGFGKNRKQKSPMIYENLRRSPEFCWLKVADRIANVEASVSDRSKAKMYVEEDEKFTALVKDHVPAAMFERYARAIDAVR